MKRTITAKIVRSAAAALGVAAVFLLLFAAGGCAAKPAAAPVELTIWHTYVEQMKDDFDELVADFNETAGAKAGVTVTVTAVANSSVLNEKLLMAANGDPGAPETPDMAVLYPKVAVTLEGAGKLVDLDAYFSADELAAYVPAFLAEGRFAAEGGGEDADGADDDRRGGILPPESGGGLYLLPIAKSTEVLYVNRTIFDRFAAETPGVTLDMLATFDGIRAAGEAYTAWTDALTPDVPGDGKAFYYPDGLFNWFQIGAEQLGGQLIEGRKIDEDTPAFRTLSEAYLVPASRGEIAIFDDYGNYLAKTGDAVCITSTSAGAQYYPDEVTYADNTKEAAVFDVLPYPVFEGGEKVAMQRGGGLCLLRSDEARERAAALFMKWLTAPEQNVRFTSRAGYMPVTQEAFDRVMAGDDSGVDNENVRKMLRTVA
ncbi:MAG: extracellular solute-binding protein, partial [Clostridiales Family XIII bacterium]|nr:extracellular solute-binding protein [Clostridiales Family XIII bacterium]